MKKQIKELISNKEQALIEYKDVETYIKNKEKDLVELKNNATIKNIGKVVKLEQEINAIIENILRKALSHNTASRVALDNFCKSPSVKLFISELVINSIKLEDIGRYLKEYNGDISTKAFNMKFTGPQKNMIQVKEALAKAKLGEFTEIEFNAEQLEIFSIYKSVAKVQSLRDVISEAKLGKAYRMPHAKKSEFEDGDIRKMARSKMTHSSDDNGNVIILKTT